MSDDRFPVHNITHKSRRMQGDWAKEEESAPQTPTEAPEFVTIEKAIRFFESNATGSIAKLYEQTAKWLRDYHEQSVKKDKE